MRVLISGLGSAIGTGVARLLDDHPDIEAICGIDLEPPRRWLQRADFHYVRPGDAPRITEIVTGFAPTAVVHCWMFEPRARSSPGQARARTISGTESVLGALARLDEPVERIIARSSLSIHRPLGGGAALHVDAPLAPRTYWGRYLEHVERRTAEVAADHGAAHVAVRTAPVLSASLPNPLGRYLRLPVVPVPLTTNTFGVVHLDDACRAFAAALTSSHDGPVAVMGPDPVTPLEAITAGGRLPLPMLRGGMSLVRLAVEPLGRPLPEHVVELLNHGQWCDPAPAADAIGFVPDRSTPEALADLYRQGEVVAADARLIGSR